MRTGHRRANWFSLLETFSQHAFQYNMSMVTVWTCTGDPDVEPRALGPGLVRLLPGSVSVWVLCGSVSRNLG